MVAPKKKTTKTPGKKTPGSKTDIKLKTTAGRTYTLIDDIKDCPLYGKSLSRSDVAREYIKENADSLPASRIVPGQLIMFNYFEPKTKEQLEYYDAGPCTIFFNVFNTEQGKRVLGFNIHYYPSKMRFQIMNKIFEIFKPIYKKYFTDGPKKEVDAFDYKYLIDELNRANLAFGVREYIPELMADVRIINPNMWKVAVFTEGWFKKRTRAAIMKFWERWLKGTKKSGNETAKGYKTKGSK